jgi:hypothetical protein
MLLEESGRAAEVPGGFTAAKVLLLHGQVSSRHPSKIVGLLPAGGNIRQ